MHRWQSKEGTVQELRAIAAFLAEVAARCDWNDKVLYHVQTAVDEACANVFEHGYNRQPGPLVIEVECAAMATIHIRDWSAGFEPPTPPTPDAALSLEERPIGGLGLLFIYQLMDEVRYQRDGEAGNCLTLRKKVA